MSGVQDRETAWYKECLKIPEERPQAHWDRAAPLVEYAVMAYHMPGEFMSEIPRASLGWSKKYKKKQGLEEMAQKISSTAFDIAEEARFLEE